MEPKEPQIKWKMENDPILRRVTYTASTGHVIKRRAVYGVKKGKSSGNYYQVDSPTGESLSSWSPTLTHAKNVVDKHISENNK